MIATLIRAAILGVLLAPGLPAGPLQEPEVDLAQWIRRLGSESVDEREEAMRFLESLDPRYADRIEREQSSDLEVRGRLASIAKTMRVRAVLSKVLRPTKRASLTVTDQPLKEVAQKLSKALNEEIRLEGLDPARRVSVTFRNATLWEALAALAGAADANYEYAFDGVRFRKGRRPSLPSRLLEQFAVEVDQVSRIDAWSPEQKGAVGLICVGLSYQRDLKPSAPHFGGGFRIDRVSDAKGEKVDVDRHPDWGGTMMIGGSSPFALKSHALIPADAAGPLKVNGRVDLPFVLEDKLIEIPLEGGKRKFEDGKISFEIQGFSNTAAGLNFSLYVEGAEPEAGNLRFSDDVSAHLQDESMTVVTADGKENLVRCHGGSTSFFRFQGETLDQPKSVKFRWNTKFHRVQFEWELGGFELPR